MFDNTGQPTPKPTGHGAQPGAPMPPANASDQLAAPTPPAPAAEDSTPAAPTIPPVAAPQKTAPTPGPVDDIFVHTDRSQLAAPAPDAVTHPEPPSPLNAGKASPFKAAGEAPSDIETSPYMATSDNAPPIAGAPHAAKHKKAPKNSKRKYFIIGIAGLAIIGGAAFAWWFFTLNTEPLVEVVPTENQQQNQQASPSPVRQVQPPTTNPLVPDVPAPTEVSENPIEEPDSPTVVDINKDTDLDGLTDEQERSLGTDMFSNDTDLDGLLDQEEVEIYLTNPTNSDTDGDGFKDGEEVSNGYNPNGAGNLIQ